MGAAVAVVDTGTATSLSATATGTVPPPWRRHATTVLVTDHAPEVADWQAAAMVGAQQVIALPGEADQLIEALVHTTDDGRGRGVVLAVAGAGGGAGASTLAAAIALTAAADRFRSKTILVDGDRLGGGLDILLGIETTAGLRWPDLVVEQGRVAATALHDALPVAAPGVSVLACGRSSGGQLPDPIGVGAMRAVLAAGRGAGDLVVCDCSGESGPHTDHMVDAADLVVLVVPARLRGVAAARVVVAQLQRANPALAVVVRGPAPGGLTPDEVAGVVGVPLLAALRMERGLAARVERSGLGTPRGSLQTAARAVLAELPETGP